MDNKLEQLTALIGEALAADKTLAERSMDEDAARRSATDARNTARSAWDKVYEVLMSLDANASSNSGLRDSKLWALLHPRRGENAD